MTLSTKKPSSPRDDNEPVLQVTSRQLMGAICILLSAACVIFLAGVTMGRSSSSKDGGTEVAQVPSEKPDSPIPVERGDPDKVEWPKAPTISKEVSPPQVSAGDNENKGVPSQDEGFRDHPAPPPADTSAETPEPRADEKPAVKPDPKATGKKPETQPASPAGKDKAEPASKPGEDKVSAGKAPAGEAAPEPETPVKTGKPAAPKGITYAVQVSSVDVTRRPWAEKYAKDLAKRIKPKPELILSPDAMRIQVIVGRSTDKKAVETIRKELKKQDEFKGCWLRTLGAE